MCLCLRSQPYHTCTWTRPLYEVWSNLHDMSGLPFQGLKTLVILLLGILVLIMCFLFFVDNTTLSLKPPSFLQRDRFKACVQPKLNPFEGDFFKRFFRTVLPYKCSDKNDWLETYNGSVFISRLIESKERENITCNIQYVQRKNDRRVGFSQKYILEGDSVLKLKNDYFKASCTGNNKSYENIHAGISYKPKVHARVNEFKDSKGLGLNILIIGFDSMSHMTYIRKLPKTYNYLKDTLNAFILNGFNAIGDGTGENLTPLLTGKIEEELPVTLKTKANAKFVDTWPFIWYELRRYGYVTGYTEDFSSVGTYTLRLRGFDKSPTDHYMRPFYLAAEPMYRRHKRFCLGNKRRTQVLYNYIKEFQTMYEDKPKFFFSFHGELSHDSLNRVESADGDLTELLKYLNVNNILNNTMLILSSDHGKRFGSSRAHPQGKMEQLLPFFSIAFPPWFHKKYPELVKNLKLNTNRLTTGFDIHEMMHDMVSFNGGGLGDITKRGISLFKEVPLSRTCEHAKISEELCTCTKWGKVSIYDRRVKKVSEFTMAHINKLTKDYRDVCAPLKLQRTKSALSKKHKSDATKFSVYQVVLSTTPGGGIFEVTVKINRVTETMKVEGRISRIDRYGTTSQCILSRNVNLRKFCYCRKKSLE